MATATLNFFTPPRSTIILNSNLKQQPSSFICKTNSPLFNTSPISSSNPPFCFLRRHYSGPPKSSRFLPKSSSTEAAAEEAPVIDVEPTQSDQETPKREQVFAVVMIGSRQYIVFPGRYLTTQRLKGANVDDKIILNKVLLVGTKTGTQTATYIGEPVVTNAVVHAVVEDVGLNPKVVVYKYKKRKNYRRNIGHRQPNTRIRITGITGYQDFPAVTMDSLKPAA